MKKMKVVVCDHFWDENKRTNCNGRFCAGCVSRLYNDQMEDLELLGTWECYKCTQRCNCAACKREKGIIVDEPALILRKKPRAPKKEEDPTYVCEGKRSRKKSRKLDGFSDLPSPKSDNGYSSPYMEKFRAFNSPFEKLLEASSRENEFNFREENSAIPQMTYEEEADTVEDNNETVQGQISEIKQEMRKMQGDIEQLKMLMGTILQRVEVNPPCDGQLLPSIQEMNFSHSNSQANAAAHALPSFASNFLHNSLKSTDGAFNVLSHKVKQLDQEQKVLPPPLLLPVQRQYPFSKPSDQQSQQHKYL